ncbi:unnamed protein product [Bursaphelenchus xylophilus]|uniref:(pine wood nematode) hypothetical protein n=1 Tax=Bursaphelenchus xylophilus TaxID=6326 RepID=A0A1I7SQQ5_BURXY|nr:unnamed protein product [Bursaphelenchus xylophilus]CAG9110237.1 unnamed protein product [Bursaphelenchus xylophilus]
MRNVSGPSLFLCLLTLLSTITLTLNEVVATLRTVIATDEVNMVAEWRLYNRCSHGFVQLFLGNVNALGKGDNDCLTRFTVLKNDWDDSFMLQQVHSKRYLCFNSKFQLVPKSTPSYRCRFKERLQKSGYSKFESKWRHGHFIGFDKDGHPISSPNSTKSHCFQFTKLSAQPNGPIRDCPTAYRRRSHRFAVPQVNEIQSASIFGILKETFLSRILV